MSDSNQLTQDRRSVDIALLVVRVVAGVIFAVHGAQKLFGAWDGPGLQFMVAEMGTLGYFVTIGEFFGGLGLIVGFLTRFSAASNVVIMIGAIVTVHGKNGFLMQNGGFEYNVALIGLMLPTVIAGAGKYAIGRFLPFLPKSKKTGRVIVGLE